MLPVLEMRDLRVEARPEDGAPVPIVNGVNLKVEKGEVLALIGESGSGKTTIALAALGYTRPGLEFAGGQVLIHGRDLLAMSAEQQRAHRGRTVAYLAQSAAASFNPAIPIGEQVIESAVLHGVMTRPEAVRRAEELYHALELPDPGRLGRRYPHQVSGGQLQRLMAAMALCGRPDLLVLDEPTTALDVTTQIEVLKAFKNVIKSDGAAAIYVTHDIPVVAQIADRIIVLKSGEVQEEGEVSRIVRRSGHDYTRRLIAAVRPAPAAAPAGQWRGVAESPPAIELAGVTAGYGATVRGRPQKAVLHDVDFAVGHGRIVGVIGESGCGKSTLARVMAGLLPAAVGELRLDGRPLHPDLRCRSRDELRQMQIVFQMADTALNPRQPIGDIIGRPLRFYHGLGGRRARDRVDELLQMVELPTSFASRYPEALSGGQKQRVNLARALAAEPKVLLCDEVTSALDTLVGAHIIELLRRLRAETGISLMFISHDLSTVASFADEIVVLYAGRIVERGPADRVLSPPYHPYTRLLIASVPELQPGWLETTPAGRNEASGAIRPDDITGAGCPFADRCPLVVKGLCDSTAPPLRYGSEGHVIACHVAPEEPSSASRPAPGRKSWCASQTILAGPE